MPLPPDATPEEVRHYNLTRAAIEDGFDAVEQRKKEAADKAKKEADDAEAVRRSEQEAAEAEKKKKSKRLSFL